ncbi:hypothetical protein NY2A_b676R [Paramecium bursaria Chlorella virus NY2A]|uniref:Uncharacterized protein b676R n=1 Tax=Paramecium bursaria Chlorella virus NY2A TaxID=46021 RepID=A7IXK1_PBCVN|nr:hypothetical protein NY2A_b676R [Paramecium bursaria Chlorella virus NY2A]ABT15075.1 hypothetical protein NY2A_b676R [Paramecium bursaria Chlorella virus NY2A]
MTLYFGLNIVSRSKSVKSILDRSRFSRSKSNIISRSFSKLILRVLFVDDNDGNLVHINKQTNLYLYKIRDQMTNDNSKSLYKHYLPIVFTKI